MNGTPYLNGRASRRPRHVAGLEPTGGLHLHQREVIMRALGLGHALSTAAFLANVHTRDALYWLDSLVEYDSRLMR